MTPTPTIVTDSREQTPLTFRNLPSQRARLVTGDYSLRGAEHLFAVERKTLSDLAQSVTTERERFFREMLRLKAYVFRRLLVIGTRLEIQHRRMRSNVEPRAIFASLAVIEVRFDVPVCFCPTEQEASEQIELWCHYFVREQFKVAEALRSPEEFGSPPGTGETEIPNTVPETEHSCERER